MQQAAKRKLPQHRPGMGRRSAQAGGFRHTGSISGIDRPVIPSRVEKFGCVGGSEITVWARNEQGECTANGGAMEKPRERKEKREKQAFSWSFIYQGTQHARALAAETCACDSCPMGGDPLLQDPLSLLVLPHRHTPKACLSAQTYFSA